MARNIETRLDKLTNAQLVTVYNSAADRQVSKFSDHTTAVNRVAAVLEAKNLDFTVDASGATVTVGPRVERTGRDGDERRITVLAEDNPKTKGSRSERRFALYAKCATVGDYVTAASKLGGGRRKAIRDITWDSTHGYIRLG